MRATHLAHPYRLVLLRWNHWHREGLVISVHQRKKNRGLPLLKERSADCGQRVRCHLTSFLLVNGNHQVYRSLLETFARWFKSMESQQQQAFIEFHSQFITFTNHHCSSLSCLLQVFSRDSSITISVEVSHHWSCLSSFLQLINFSIASFWVKVRVES